MQGLRPYNRRKKFFLCFHPNFPQNHLNYFTISKFWKLEFQIWTKKIFFPLWYGRSPCIFTLKSCFFLEFFFIQNLIYLVHLVHFLLFLWSIWQTESLLLCFWKDSGWMCSLIYLVIVSIFDFYLLIVKKSQCSCVFCTFPNFHLISVTSRFFFFW